MKHDILKQFASLQKALTEEKASLEARLQELNRVLGAESSASASETADSGVSPAGKKKRTMSAAGRAKIIAAQKARWAKYNAERGVTSKPAKKTKRTMSPEAKAKIAAAQKKRWAKFHAAQGK